MVTLWKAVSNDKYRWQCMTSWPVGVSERRSVPLIPRAAEGGNRAGSFEVIVVRFMPDDRQHLPPSCALLESMHLWPVVSSSIPHVKHQPHFLLASGWGDNIKNTYRFHSIATRLQEIIHPKHFILSFTHKLRYLEKMSLCKIILCTVILWSIVII